jgi:hypothetical protein
MTTVKDLSKPWRSAICRVADTADDAAICGRRSWANNSPDADSVDKSPHWHVTLYVPLVA